MKKKASSIASEEKAAMVNYLEEVLVKVGEKLQPVGEKDREWKKF
jgi:hypothetical protein